MALLVVVVEPAKMAVADLLLPARADKSWTAIVIVLAPATLNVPVPVQLVVAALAKLLPPLACLDKSGTAVVVVV